MSINDICLNIPYYEAEFVARNVTYDFNTTISFIEAPEPPLVFTINNDTKICGPLVKILENLSEKLGSK